MHTCSKHASFVCCLHTYIHMYVYICICICTYIHIYENMPDTSTHTCKLPDEIQALHIIHKIWMPKLQRIDAYAQSMPALPPSFFVYQSLTTGFNQVIDYALGGYGSYLYVCGIVGLCMRVCVFCVV